MSEARCKAAICAGGCLDAIIVDNARELTEVAVKLVVNGLLDEDQEADIIDLYTRYEDEVKRRIETDHKLRSALKVIIGV